MSKKQDQWRARVTGHCHQLWGRGGFEMMTNLVWEALWETEARRQLTEYEFAHWVVCQWCAHHYWHRDKPTLESPAAFGEMKRVRAAQRRAIEYDEWYKRVFIQPAARVARTAANPPAKKEEADEPIDVGGLEQPPRDRARLRRIFASTADIPYELRAVTPQAVLVWAEETTDWFADRGEFPTVQCLVGMVHRMPDLDYDEAVVASRTLIALYRAEDEQERAEVRRLCERAAAPEEVKEKGKEAKEEGGPKVRPTSTVQTRTGAAGAVTVTEGKKGGKKYRIWGHPVTAVLRWMGGDAWTFSDARTALELLGVPDVNDNTVKAQLLAGRKGGDCDGRGPAADLTADQQNTLNDMVQDGEEAHDEPQGRGGPRPGEQAGAGRHQARRQAEVEPVPHDEEAATRPAHRNGKAHPGTGRAEDGAPAVRPPDQPARLRGRAGGPTPGKKNREGGVGEGGAGRPAHRGQPVVGKGRGPSGDRRGGKAAGKVRKKLKRK